jgi:hypothetical protein
VTAFIGHAELPEEQKIILQNFVDSVNSKSLKCYILAYIRF